jgi:hypothetical protein
METKQLSNKKSHNPIHPFVTVLRNSLTCNKLRTTSGPNTRPAHRETLLSHWKQRRYDRQKAIMALIAPSTFSPRLPPACCPAGSQFWIAQIAIMASN